MRSKLVPLAVAVMVTAAHAQSGKAPHIDLLPVPKNLPPLFFWPESLAGTMLRPLTEPQEEAQESRGAGEASSQAEPASGALATSAEPAAGEAALPAGELEEPIGEPAEALAPPPATQPESEAATAPGDDAAGDEGQAAAPAEPGEPAAPETTTVHIIVENVESDAGRVNVAVCDTSLSEDGCPYHTSVPASAGFVEAELTVPPGRYAVVGYHDVNNNDQFDKFLGVPREPYALSGRAAESLVPDFNDAALKINQGANYVIIRMKRLGNG